MIKLNYANMMSGSIGRKGLEESDIGSIAEYAKSAHEKIINRSVKGLGFLDILNDDTKEIKSMGKEIRSGFESFLLLGIGGSALGPKCILEAVSPLHNMLKSPKVFIYDNVDPFTLKTILSAIDTKTTAVNVITKSGSTAETMASFMIFEEMLHDRPKNIIATTDPEKGNLRKLAAERGYKTLSVPPDVGGRFSVLSSVGLLPAEVFGTDCNELLRGARDVMKACSTPETRKNPAYMFGALQYLMDKKFGRRINVLIPYCDRLRTLSEWFCQIWAESLGKEGKGLTPYPSIGTTDQHSQMQLWMEGPEDKTVSFIRVNNHGADVKLPNNFVDSEIGYLGGQSLAALLNAEEESSELCLRKAGRPNMTIEVPEVSAYTLGGLFTFFEIATAFTGFLYGINPFNQPSIEEGKSYTYGMMGRKGYETKRAEVEAVRSEKLKYTV